MEHLLHLIESTYKMSIPEIIKFYKDNYDCKVNVNETHGLFCPMYSQIKTKFTEKGSLATRGTVFALDDNGVFRGDVVCVPFFKFFNSHESLAHKGEDSDIISIQRKMDGSLIKVFYHNNQWFIATNGTPVAMEEFSDLFQRSINLSVDRFDDVFNREHTYLFEMCTPENRIVVDYEGRYFATLLMVRCRLTFDELPLISAKGHFDYIHEVDGFDNAEVGEEGVVVIYRGGHRVKKKTEWYKKLHKCNAKSFNGSDFVNVLAAFYGGYYDDVLAMIPKKNREKIEEFKKGMAALDKEIESKLALVQMSFEKQTDKEKLVHVLKTGEFDLMFPDKELRKAVLNVLFGKIPDIYQCIGKHGQKGDRVRRWVYNCMSNDK